MNQRYRTISRYNLQYYDPDSVEGKYQMPKLEPTYTIPKDLIGFNEMLPSKRTDCGIHFYLDDYQFERIWDRPEYYIERMKRFQCALTPDFSLYMDMPIGMKTWNTYRSRQIGQQMQRVGIDVIPTVSWAEPETYEFCFDGLPHGSVLSVSTMGVRRDDKALAVWQAGMNEMIERCKPKALVIYGTPIEYEYKSVEVIYFANKTTDRMDMIKKGLV